MDTLPEDTNLVDLERLSTPKKDLLMFRAGPIDEGLLHEARERRFDHAPVVDDENRLLGIIPIPHVENLFIVGRSIETNDANLYLQVLSDRMPILSFLQEIGEHRAVVIRDTDNEHDEDWFALVTISDLNRHAFRARLYPMVAELETALAELIEEEFTDPWVWIESMSEERQVQHIGSWKLAERKNVETSPVVNCTLMDLLNIVGKTASIREELGYKNRTRFNDMMNPFRTLRNQIMHPVRPFILDREDVMALQVDLRNLVDLTARVHTFNQNTVRPDRDQVSE